MSDDFDESAFTLGTATAGVPTFGDIETAFDRDWFAVNLVYGRVYQFELRGAETSDGTLLDPYIPGLFDSDDNSLSGVFADESSNTLNHEFVYVPYYGGLYYVSASANGGGTGTYTLEFVDLEGNTLATGLDDLIVGTGFADTLNGLAGNDSIYGLEGNDLLEGGDGNDTIFGGLGQDTLRGGEGDDRLNDSHPDDFTLDPAFPDALYGGNGNDTLNGNNAFLYGEAGDDALSGGPYLDGGTGADEMFDARGGPTIYIVDNVGDFVAEYLYDSYGPGNTATGDVDEIRSWIDWALRDWNDDGFNVENLTLLGSADLSASGNEVANVITGNSGNNHLDGGSAGNDTLYGFGGADTIAGGTGNDLMSGGEGADVFVFAPGDGNDTISDFVVGTDSFDLTAFGGQVIQIATQNGAGDRVITVNSDVTITLTGVPLNYDPEITSPAPVFATQDVPFTYTLTATDLDGDSVDYDPLNSTLPSWLIHTGGFIFSGTPLQADVGRSPVTIAVGDGTGGNDSQIFELTVAPVQTVILERALNEGQDLTILIDALFPAGLPSPFPGTGSPDELIAAIDLSVVSTSSTAILGEDYTLSYEFGETQTLGFAALDDDIVENDETVQVRVTGFVDWIIPNEFSEVQILNLLNDPVRGYVVTVPIDISLNVVINSAPEGVTFPILSYTFTGAEVIGNVLTDFTDGSLEIFSAVPFSFDSGPIIGELLANGDLSITDSSAIPGQSLILLFDVVDERGATTSSEQIIQFGALQDDYIPGETAAELGSIAIDTSELGSVETSGDRDRFQVTLEAGQIYSIGLASATSPSGTLADPEIFGVFNSFNTPVPGSSDNDSGSGLNALLDQLIVETSGVYEIEVGSHTDFGSGGYELTVESLSTADDFLPGDFAGTYGSALVNIPAMGTIESNGDRDRFEITLEAGVVYDISLEGLPTGGGSNPNPEIIGVFNSANNLLANSADNNGGVDTNALVSGLVVDADGIYQIEVAGAQDVNIGDYTLTVDFAGFVDDFLPGISDGLGSVSVGGLTTGEIETTGDIDGFRVSLQANTTYEINILGRDSNNGTLLDPDLVGIFSSSDLSGTPITSVQTLNTQFVGDDSTSYFTPQTAGEFYIGVQDQFGGTGTYTVAVDNIGVRDDYSSDIDTSGSIAPGSSALGRVDFAQDNDWFEVNLSANRLYEIELVPTAGGNALADPFFRGVYDGNGVLIQNTENDDGGTGTSSSLQFVTDDAGTFYLAAGGFGDTTGQYRLELNDLGPLDDNSFDITLEYTSDDVPDEYIDAFENAVERWERIITGDLPYAFVEGYGFIDDILIEVAVEDMELTFEGVDQTILAISTVLDQRADSASGSGALPTYSRIVINPEDVGTVLNLDELIANTIGRALGFGSLWEEFGLVRDIDGVATYTGGNALREMEVLSDNLNGVIALEDGRHGALAAEYWHEDVFGFELMTPLVALRRPSDGPAPFGRPDNPISELTIAAMEDLGYQVDYGAADRFRLSAGALDGYLAGAKIYVDTNGDGVPDPDEDTGITTDAHGFFSFNQADGVLSAPTLVVGGTNTDTGLPNELILSAPQGSYIVSPITSLIQHVIYAEGGAVDDATAMIEAALGITADIDLLVYDPLSQEPDDAVAVSTQILAAQLAVLATLSRDGETFSDIAAYILANGSQVLDLADFSQLKAMFPELSDDVLSGIANINQALAGAVSLTDISEIQGEGLADDDTGSSLTLDDITLIASGLSDITEVAIQQIFVGLLGRPVAAGGETYWKGEVEADNGFGLTELMSNIVNQQPEYINAFSGLDREAAVTLHFNYLFARDPTFDNEGNNYWVDGGGSAIPTDQLVLALLLGVLGDDKRTLSNKMFVASYISDNEPDLAAPAGLPVLGAVNSTLDSVIGTLQAVDLFA